MTDEFRHSNNPETDDPLVAKVRALGHTLLVGARINAELHQLDPNGAISALLYAAACIAASHDSIDAFEELAQKYGSLIRSGEATFTHKH